MFSLVKTKRKQILKVGERKMEIKIKSLLCVTDGRVVFASESFCGAPISDYAQIKECLAEQLGIQTTELLEST
jgi:hypothetical protein